MKNTQRLNAIKKKLRAGKAVTIRVIAVDGYSRPAYPKPDGATVQNISGIHYADLFPDNPENQEVKL